MFKAGKLGGGLKYALFSSLFGVIIQFDVFFFKVVETTKQKKTGTLNRFQFSFLFGQDWATSKGSRADRLIIV